MEEQNISSQLTTLSLDETPTLGIPTYVPVESTNQPKVSKKLTMTPEEAKAYLAAMALKEKETRQKTKLKEKERLREFIGVDDTHKLIKNCKTKEGKFTFSISVQGLNEDIGRKIFHAVNDILNE